MNLRELGSEGVDYIHLTQVSFTRTLLHGVS
jgi:hypothetical protein